MIPSPAHAVWHLGAVPLRLQGAFAVAGVVLALVLAERRYRKAGGRPGTIIDLAVWAVPAGLIPAALGVALAPARGAPWAQIRTRGEAVGYPGAVTLGFIAIWIAGRRRRIRFEGVAGALAPAVPFGLAVASLGNWAAQEGYGHPTSLWWAVQISPAHRLSGYENFATFQPMFMYGALWDVAVGVAVMWATRWFSLAGDRALALAAFGYALGGFAGFWLGIGHLPLVLGVRAGELGDVIVGVGSITFLARTRHRGIPSSQATRKLPLERDSSVM